MSTGGCGSEQCGVFCALQESPEREPWTSEETGLLHHQPPPSAPLRPGHQTHLGPDGSFRKSSGQDCAVHCGQLQVISFILSSPAVTQHSTSGIVVAEWWTVLGITYSVSIILLWSLRPAWPAASVCSNKLFTLTASARAKWCIDTPLSETSNMKCPHRYVTLWSAVLVIVDIRAKIESLALCSDDSSDWSRPIWISRIMFVAGKILCATRLWIYLWEEKLVQRTSCSIGCWFIQA